MAASTDVAIDWDAEPSGLTLSGKIAEALAREIRRGRFAPGAKLPSSRRLADQLGVHRNTVLSAIDDLLDQGYVSTQPGRGVFVAERIFADRPAGARALVAPSRRASPPEIDLPLARDLPQSRLRDVRPGDLPLLGGLPDLRLAPVRELSRAYKSALKKAPSTLDYQSERGEPKFLEVFSRYLAETRGVVSEEGGLLTTRGSQQALFLAGRVVCPRGDVIAVEGLGYPPAWQAFHLAGAEVRPVRVDRGGIVLSDLERLAETECLRAVYVTPHHQYPTTVTMSGPRRAALLRLAERKKFFVIEDDYDHEFHFEGRPVLPLASFDLSSLVIHIGTFSKVFAPGVRLGYVSARPRVVEAMCQVRRVLDRQGDHTMERALATLIEEGAFAAHLRRMHRVYAERREVLFDELARRLSDRLSFARPGGGLAVWARVLGSDCDRRPDARRASGVLAEQWAASAERAGVHVQPGRDLAFDARPKSYLRLGYPRLSPGEIRTAVARLCRSHPGSG